ncbi:MAG: 5'-nucleotidase C-terminal domain-containing protein [Bacteroidales bacterium]|nr:5'-nucleotidase C-terminal domain-containing protein [Bacteroidales bacterium]
MKKLAFILIALSVLVSCKSGFTWEKVSINGRLTGVTAPSADNIPEALGKIAEDGSYVAPNGAVFTCGATPAVATALICAQPAMADVKEVIAFSTRAMSASRPESELSNFVVDFVREETARVTGMPTDVAVTNFGGIRVDMPEGDVLLDDIRSMFPFVNKLCWVQLSGENLLHLMNEIAEYGPQCVSGVKMVIADHKLESVEVGGQPIDPKKKYGVATVDFLLDGGDNIHVGYGATKLIVSDTIIGDAIEKYIRQLTAEGKAIEYQTDGRVIVK